MYRNYGEIEGANIRVDGTKEEKKKNSSLETKTHVKGEPAAVIHPPKAHKGIEEEGEVGGHQDPKVDGNHDLLGALNRLEDVGVQEALQERGEAVHGHKRGKLHPPYGR